MQHPVEAVVGTYIKVMVGLYWHNLAWRQVILLSLAAIEQVPLAFLLAEAISYMSGTAFAFNASGRLGRCSM